MIQTENLSLVPADVRHLDALVNDRALLAGMLGARVPENFPHSMDAVPWFRSLLEADSALYGWLFFFAIDTEERVVVGDGGFKGRPDEAGVIEIGYSTVPEFRNRGLATEIARGLIDYAFSHLEITAVQAHTRVDNAASIKVLKRLGLKVVDRIEDKEEGEMFRWRVEAGLWSGAQ